MTLHEPKIEPEKIGLNVLICDATDAADVLREALGRENCVQDIRIAPTVAAAREALTWPLLNTIIIDPLSENLELASDFIFGVRASHTQIVFVLYVDLADAEKHRSEFYSGERRRFSHYFVLDKRTPIAAFQDELRSVIHLCQGDLSWRMSELNLRRLLDISAEPGTTGKAKTQMALVEAASSLFARLSDRSQVGKSQSGPKNVFLSYRFADQEYVDGLTELLNQNGFAVETGRSANTYISKAILERIKRCDFFLCLMTKNEAKVDGTYTTSGWLLEEKGAALAFGKPLVLMIEEGVTDFGGLQGDWQRIHFGARGFLKAALEAVTQLRSWAG